MDTIEIDGKSLPARTYYTDDGLGLPRATMALVDGTEYSSGHVYGTVDALKSRRNGSLGGLLALGRKVEIIIDQPMGMSKFSDVETMLWDGPKLTPDQFRDWMSAAISF